MLAVIWVPRSKRPTHLQIGIIVGKGGAALKQLGLEARHEIEEFLGRPVFLELKVQLSQNWRENKEVLGQFGYFDPLLT